MKNILLLSFFTLTSLLLLGQPESSIVVFNVDGKVNYTATAGEKGQKVKAGMLLSESGTLNFKKSATLGIYYDDQLGYFEMSGIHPVESLIKQVKLFEESDLSEIFGEDIMAASNPYFASVTLKRSGFTGNPVNKPPKKEEKEGHGNKKYKLIRITPTGGKVAGNTIDFKWSYGGEGKAPKSFIFTLSNTSGEAVHEVTVKGYSYSLENAAEVLTTGQKYRWQVKSVADETVLSNPVTFTYVAVQDELGVLRELASDAMYQKGNAATKLMMEAAMYEAKGFHGKAAAQLELLQKSAKKNPLAQNMYKAYLWEYDLVKE